ncbi:unnamed protein product [Cladocopium goreaui]|uniref:Sterol 3-beta-glucosyltransferase UGT80B1 n=1 Tax=Cladocopium goreaui TaxID=2562237 RepID=A0A9P1G8G6_9DINO|nr:unnamed protein product [Cladocopium goreaui]
MFVFDLSIFRPQCALEFPYFWKWLFHWALFFVMIVLLLVIMLAIGRNHKNAQHDWKYISKKQALLSMFSASLLLFTLVHLRDDLIFAQCIACEDDKFCLAEQPVIYCDMADSVLWSQRAMAVLSVMDLFLVIGSTVPILAITIYKSWKWQHGDEIALSSDFLAPWYVYISEMLVERHIGYIKEVREAVPEFEQAYKDLHTDGMRQEVWSKAIDIILAHEAEKAEVFLRRMIRHLYNHNPRFNVIDEDSGPTFALIRAILRSDEEEENETGVPKEESAVESLKAADIHHITITLNNLLDTARWTIPGLRVIKRWLGYSWSLVLLIVRFAILTFAMLMPRDREATVPLAYVITKLVSLVMEAALAPYQWTYLNDWASRLAKWGKGEAEKQMRKLLKGLAKNQAEVIFGILQLCGDRRVRLDARQYTLGITSCGSKSLWQHACSLFAAMPTAQVAQNVISYNALLNSLEKGAQWYHSLRLFKSMASSHSSHQPDVISYTAAIISCEKGQQWQHALQLFFAMPKMSLRPNVFSYCALISCLKEAKKWQQALVTFQTMPMTEVVPNVVSFNATISACEKVAEWQQAFSIFSQMPQDLPDVVSYSTLISSCGRAGNWQQALRIFADMSKVRVQANIFSFNAIISSCEKDGKWQQGLSFFDQMSKLEISPDIISYNAVISACEKGGQWQQALQIFEAMPKMKTQADIISYNAVISSCEKFGKWQHALWAFSAMGLAKVR